jgi:hypothetical protein
MILLAAFHPKVLRNRRFIRRVALFGMCFGPLRLGYRESMGSFIS